MIRIGDVFLGFFYTKDGGTFAELDGGSATVSIPYKYARTATPCVAALLDHDMRVLDVDDIPCEDAFSATGEQFVSFLKGGEKTVFVVPFELLDEECATSGRSGELSSLSVSTDAFTLDVLTIGNIILLQDVMQSGKYLVLATNGNVGLREKSKTVTVSCARAAIVDIPL